MACNAYYCLSAIFYNVYFTQSYFTGSGGNNHAVEYYEQTKYSLAVKLGTITSEGGDVYSYDEDEMVEDPKLKEHLLHFGINIALLEKVRQRCCGYIYIRTCSPRQGDTHLHANLAKT